MKISDLADLIQNNEQAITNILYNNGKLATECFDTFFCQQPKRDLSYDSVRSLTNNHISEIIRTGKFSAKRVEIDVVKIFLTESGVLTIKGKVNEDNIELPFDKLKEKNKVQVFKMFYGHLV